MSLRNVKNGYLIVVIIIAVLLATLGHWLGWVAAVVLLAGALPAWNIVTRLAGDQGADQALSVVEHHLSQQ